MKFYAISAILHTLLFLGLSLSNDWFVLGHGDEGVPVTVELMGELTMEQVVPQMIPYRQIKKAVKKKIVHKGLEPAEKPLLKTKGKQSSTSDVASSSIHGSQQVGQVNYGQALSSYITRNTFYPRRARKLKQTGVVKVKVHISPSGEFQNVHIEEACNHNILNKAAIDLIKKLGRFRPLPSSVSEGVDYVIPIQYQISRGS